jgi:fructosamine-3-kinase
VIAAYRSLDDAIEALEGPAATIARRVPVSGGCIANGTRVELSTGTRLFLKESSTLPSAMFPAEARGLSALRCADGPRVPTPLATSEDGARISFIVMEYVESGRPASGFHERFGRELAGLHTARTSGKCGFDSDNFIGSTAQPNHWTGGWVEFFSEHRLCHQQRLARDRGLIGDGLSAAIDSIRGRLASLLVEQAPLSLLHGDLWSGNYMCDSDGAPVLIDPAVYFGHREADLAMTELFGGFSRAFYRAYDEAFPLEPGYEERRDLYNLYHMLNHLNIFGGGYLGSVTSIVGRYR